MTSSRPYLVRAIYEWLVDNNLTPHLIVNAEAPGVVVPREFVEQGKIVLNIAPQAVQGLRLGNDAVEFHARFGGRPHSVHVPVQAALALYARENGRGMVFPEEGDGGTPPEPPPDAPDPKPEAKPDKPRLKLIKN